MKFVVLCLALFAVGSLGQNFLGTAQSLADQAASTVTVPSNVAIPSTVTVPSTDNIQQTASNVAGTIANSVPSTGSINQTAATDAVNSAVNYVNESLGNVTVPSVDSINQTTVNDAANTAAGYVDQNYPNATLPSAEQVNQTATDAANAAAGVVTIPSADSIANATNAIENYANQSVAGVIPVVESNVNQTVSTLNDEIDFDTNLEGFYTEGEVFTSEFALSEAELNEFDLTAEQGEFEIYGDDDGLVGGWTDVDASDVETNAELKSALDYGFETVVSRLVNTSAVPRAGEYAISEIYNVSSQVVAGMNYQFHVQAHNGNATYLDLLYTVYSDLNGAHSLTDSSYKVYTA